MKSDFKKNRHAVLDKLSKLGQGLSDAQKTDFGWFKDAWDAAMCEEHGQEWGSLFAMQVQCILDDISNGQTNAFSLLMHNETLRVLNSPALRM